MKKFIYIILLVLIFQSCNSSKTDSADKSVQASEQSEENFTGVKKYYEGEILKKEVTFKNGIKEGLNKNYYDDGRLKRTIWYENNLKEDTAKWYYTDGSVYRATPYKNDKIQGIQIKYHRNGRIMAEIPYRHGLRTPGLKEYYDNGLEVGNIPSITIQKINSTDYSSDGVVSITLALSNKSKNVKFYKGGLVDGAFDPKLAKDITASSGMAYFEVYKKETGGKNYVDVVAEYTTRFRNKEIIIRRIKLPYDDLG
jgi:antitoxin component YwqK of YwqJK toxin-antitoxin module